MIIIYDFDGTLTPYGLPQYEILKQCGYDDDKIIKKVNSIMQENNLSLYEAYCQTYEHILKENDLPLTIDNIILGADKVEFNKGVLEYFKDLEEKNSGIKHFIITSGFEEYVYHTPIAPYINKIYGTTYKVNNGICTNIDRLVTGTLKSILIKEIIKEHNPKKVIYIGDGLTDKDAFEYTHSIGGTCLFIGSSKEDKDNFNKLKENNIVDYYFKRDFSKNSDIRKYIEKI